MAAAVASTARPLATAATAAAVAVAIALLLLVGDPQGVVAQNGNEPEWLPALHRACLRCLCEAATGCNASIGCTKGYCGPFKVARLYWKEAGNIVLPDDDPERAGAYEDCARQYQCASRLVTAYMVKLGKDCNGDGLVNCDDFALIHFHGGYSCQQSLDKDEAGRLYEARYKQCRPPDEDEDPLGRSVWGVPT